MQHQPISVAAAQPASSLAPAGFRRDIFALSGGGEVVLTLPDSLSQRDYDDLKDWLDLMGRKAQRAIKEPASSPAARTAATDNTEEEPA